LAIDTKQSNDFPKLLSEKLSGVLFKTPTKFGLLKSNFANFVLLLVNLLIFFFAKTLFEVLFI
jgi:hypothetical protein